MVSGGAGASGPLDDEPLDDLDEPWAQPGPDPAVAPALTPRRRRRTAVVLVCGGAALVGVLVGASALLRSPQERLQARVSDAFDAAGVELAGPVSLRSSDGARLWTGRVAVLDDDGGTTGVQVAVRVDEGPGRAGGGADEEGGDGSAAAAVGGLFPLVDCSTRYPLTYPGDSDTSFRTTRGDLAECSSAPQGEGVLVTIAWVDDGNRDDGVADGPGTAPVDRQTWLTDGRGGLVWMHNADDDGEGGDRDGARTGGGRGLTGEQQRAVASAEGLLEAL